MKLFYKKSLLGLSRVVHKFVQYLFGKRFGQQSLAGESFPFLTLGWEKKRAFLGFITKKRMNNAVRPSPSGQVLRAVIVSRNTVQGKPNSRSLAVLTEQSIKKKLEALGIQTTICNFSNRHLQNGEHLWEMFSVVDICIGVHGAGLSNCILMREGGIWVELQSLYAFGSDLFMKMAHMSRATYIHINIRPLFKKGKPTQLPQQMVNDLIKAILVVALVKSDLNRSSTPPNPVSRADQLLALRKFYSQTSGTSRCHVSANEHIMLIPPDAFEDDEKAQVRDAAASSGVEKCVQSPFYCFQKIVLPKHNITRLC